MSSALSHRHHLSVNDTIKEAAAGPFAVACLVHCTPPGRENTEDDFLLRGLWLTRARLRARKEAQETHCCSLTILPCDAPA